MGGESALMEKASTSSIAFSNESQFLIVTTGSVELLKQKSPRSDFEITPANFR